LSNLEDNIVSWKRGGEDVSLYKRLLPDAANNNYLGSKIAIYGLAVLLIPLTFRSLVHFLKDDSGVNSIATILTFSGSPDPNTVIYLFSSLWGGQQLLFVFLAAIVLVRYRSLIPLMFSLFVVECFFRVVSGALHGLGPEYYESRPPGSIGTYVFLVYGVVMLYLSLRERRSEYSERGEESA
tara:strand:+ start:45 stop:590 length:546 start_codon:yes stop_codon:yes gene_type:complete